METVETEELRKYCVYLITNLVNGKQYAGQTRRSVEERWKEHVYYSQRQNSFLLHSAIRKYGPQCFAVTVLRNNLTKEQANEEEKLAIQTLHLNNTEFGYNLTKGGEGRSGDFHSWLSTPEMARLYSTGKTMKEVARILGCKLATVFHRLKRDGIPRRKPGRSDIDVLEARKLYEQGHTLKQIALMYDTDRNTLRSKMGEIERKSRAKTPPDISPEEIAKLFHPDTSVRGLAKRLGTTREIIREKLIEAGAVRKPGRQPRAGLDEKEMIRLYKEGHNLAAIGKVVGCVASTVRLRLIQNGIDTSWENNAR